jgi:hypothetical protein
MSELSGHPHIELSYWISNGDQGVREAFEEAGTLYEQSLTKNEGFNTSIEERDKDIFVTYGKNILRAMSYADIGNQADVMRAKIEKSIAELGHASALEGSYTGQYMSGTLPDPE